MGNTNQNVLGAQGAQGTTKRGPGRPKGSGATRQPETRGKIDPRQKIADIANRAIKANTKVIEYLKTH